VAAPLSIYWEKENTGTHNNKKYRLIIEILFLVFEPIMGAQR
jgi:hypothetical protein